MSAIVYRTDVVPSVEQFRSVLVRSGLAERRPVADERILTNMLRHANLTVTAWDGETLAGIGRSVTDFSFCCYLSDLAVDRAYQRRGIGARIIAETRQLLDSSCLLILLSAPNAVTYYEALGMERHTAAFVSR